MPLSINVGLSRKASRDYQSTGASINVTAELDQSLLARPAELGKYTPPNGTDYPAGTTLIYTVQFAGKTSGGKVYYQYEWTSVK